MLINGKTFHSQFKIYPPITDATTSRIELSSLEAISIRDVKLIIWDEATRTPSPALTVVDRLLKDVMGNNLPFGGKVLLLGDDFRQCLPVIPHGHRVAIIQSTIKYCPVWPEFRFLEINTEYANYSR